MSSSLRDQRLKTIDMISSINNDLRAKGHKVTLVIQRNSIRIRGTFPFSDGSKKRTYISSGLSADIKSAPIAEIRAIALLGAIKETGCVPNPLPWENKKLDKTGYPKVKCKDAILQLKEEFFGVNSRNKISRENTWTTMSYGLKLLDPDALCTTDYLASVIQNGTIDPDTGDVRENQKLKLKTYYKRLGKLIGLPDINSLDKIEVAYEPKKRDIPNHSELLEFALEVRNHPRYGWLSCCMILYGCRPSEALSLFPSDNGTAKVLTIKKKKGLPVRRTAMALPPEYVEKLNMLEITRPLEFINPIDFNPKRSKQITDQWGRWIKKVKPALQLYDLRHSWATRSIVEGVPTGLAAKSMGTSIKMFGDTYLETLDDNAISNYLKNRKK